LDGVFENNMTNHRKHRGYASQRMVADFLKENGYEYATSAGAGSQGTDIINIKNVDFEVKARRGFPIAEAMKQLKERSKEDHLAVAVLRLDGTGSKTIESWPAILTLGALVELLKKAGYR
jgi:hypothetical protein